jgi:hypothetical protein
MGPGQGLHSTEEGNNEVDASLSSGFTQVEWLQPPRFILELNETTRHFSVGFDI